MAPEIYHLHNDQRRLFVLDTEADISSGEHILTHVCIGQVHINYELGTYDVVRWFIYDYNDEWPDMPARMRQQLGGCGAFLIDVAGGLFANSIILAHNFSGYDSYHLLQLFTVQCDELLVHQVSPCNLKRPRLNINFSNFIAKGSKIVTFDMPYLNMHFVDTMLMLPGSLSALARSMSIDMVKGHFPYSMPQVRSETAAHHMPHPINYCYPGLPPMKFYINQSDKEERQQAVCDWYNEETKHRTLANIPFITHREHATYCQNDTNMLAHIVGKASLKEYCRTGRQLFAGRPTITSYTYQLFVDDYMLEGQIAIIPDQGYGRAKGSRIADRLLLISCS